MARRRIIRLQYKARCRACGTSLPEGARARYYGRGRVYGVDCHDKDDNPINEQSPVIEEYPTVGHCTCEDRPCCGCDDRDQSSPFEYSEGYDWANHNFDNDPDWR